MPVTDADPPDIQYLQKAKLFKGLGPAELRAVYNLGRPRRAKAGAFFFHLDDPANTLYVLTAGHVKMAQIGPEGHQVLVRIVKPGEDFGTIFAITGVTYPLSAQAGEDCRALTWDELTTKRLLSTYPQITLNALQLVAGRFKQLQERYRELATERVERRVARALLRLVNQAGRRVNSGILIDLSLSRQDLAEMTGTTLYTVSRILNSWERENMVEVGRGQVIIRRQAGIEAIAEDLPPAVLSRYSA